MNANGRVAVNALATYGRTLLRMGLGLFSSRWVLESLGEVDYGLMGVIGSLIVFITFLNSVFTGACSRFFAFSIGKNDLKDLREWFNTGLSVHLILAIVLVAIGYPIGEWAIDNFLNIPSDRIVTARWVFRLSLLSAFWTMFSTPYSAMYTATQNIVELTLWEVLNILTNFGFVYWLTTYHGDSWLVYVSFTVGLTVLIGLGQVFRARYKFAGCRINFHYWKNWERTKEMFSFSTWSLFGSLGYLARANVPSVMLNQFFSPIKYAYVNASYQVGISLAGYTQSMSNSLVGAFLPQITTLAGANQKEKMVNTSFAASKFGTLLTLIFAVPVFVEADYLLVLWLKNPPLLAAGFCRIVLLQMIIDNMTFGNMAGIMASGKIKWYQITTGTICLMSVPISWLVLKLGGNPLSVSWVITICVAANSIARVYFGEKILGISAQLWFNQIAYPIFLVTGIATLIGICITKIMPEHTIWRLILTTIVTSLALGIMTWKFILKINEKGNIKNIFKRILNKCNIKSCLNLF